MLIERNRKVSSFHIYNERTLFVLIQLIVLFWMKEKLMINLVGVYSNQFDLIEKRHPIIRIIAPHKQYLSSQSIFCFLYFSLFFNFMLLIRDHLAYSKLKSIHQYTIQKIRTGWITYIRPHTQYSRECTHEHTHTHITWNN